MGGYPPTKYAAKSHLDIAADLHYYEGVSILQHEEDTPAFWRRMENLRYGKHDKTMVEEFMKAATITIKLPHDRWILDKEEYESFAPSCGCLYDVGRYDRTEESQRAEICTDSTKALLDTQKFKHKYMRERTSGSNQFKLH